MDKIREKFKKRLTIIFDELTSRDEQDFMIYRSGYKSADLLPTEKVCPECNGHSLLPITLSGELASKPDRKCPKCKDGKIQIYYTPEQYEKIMGAPFPDDGAVWWYDDMNEDWRLSFLKHIRKNSLDEYNYLSSRVVYIVQTAQPAPPADYREETK